MEPITKEQYNEFKSIDKNTVKVFSLANKAFIGKVVDVYDGDTCKIVIYYKNEFVKFNIRMYGYDSPELKTKNTIEKQFSLISKQMLEKLILNKIVKIFCHDFDKYGRLLGSIFINDKNTGEEIDVNNFMINKHFGYSYLGEKKTDFNDMLDYYKDITIINIDTLDYTIDFNIFTTNSISDETILKNNSICENETIKKNNSICENETIKKNNCLIL